MSIKFVSGDLLSDEGITAIAHGCNCQGVMGSGIALPIKIRYPKNFTNYNLLCKVGTFVPGFVYHSFEEGKHIFNCATQNHFGDAKLIWIDICLKRMLEIAKYHQIKQIGMPRIGAGLGGLEWVDVKELMIKRLDEFCSTSKGSVEFIVFENFVEGQINYLELY